MLASSKKEEGDLNITKQEESYIWGLQFFSLVPRGFEYIKLKILKPHLRDLMVFGEEIHCLIIAIFHFAFVGMGYREKLLLCMATVLLKSASTHEQLGEMMVQVVEQHLQGCHLLLLTTKMESPLALTILR